jgi:MFS family permease
VIDGHIHPYDGGMRGLFYGWYVALACGVGIACGLACVVTYTFPIFLTPLAQEFGWSAPDIFTGLLVTTLTVVIAAPALGPLVDRIGARRMILAGLGLEALVLASFAWQGPSLAGFYLRYVLLAALGLGATHVAFARVISLWFDRQRGLALGVTLAGLGIGGFIWPLLTQWSIDTWGWRNTYLLLATLVAVVGMSVVGVIVRNSPAEMGLLADGEGSVGARKAAVLAGVDVPTALRTGRLWLLVLAFLLIGIAITSVQLHLVPLLKSRGVPAMQAAAALSILAIALVVGRLGAGWLMDRFFAPRVAIAFLLGPIVAVAVLASGATGTVALLAGILTGLAAGAEVDVTAYLAGRYFGLAHFSGIYAWFYSAYSLGAGLGPRITASAVESFGGYTEILAVHGVLLVIAALLLSRLGPFPRWE